MVLLILELFWDTMAILLQIIVLAILPLQLVAGEQIHGEYSLSYFYPEEIPVPEAVLKHNGKKVELVPCHVSNYLNAKYNSKKVKLATILNDLVNLKSDGHFKIIKSAHNDFTRTIV